MSTARQQSTWPFIGQAHIGRYLIDALDAGRLPRALLFCGPRAVGKATAAEWLIQYNLCRQAHRPCGTCAACVQVSNHQHPSAVILSGTERVGIDDVRDLIAAYHVAPWNTDTRWLVITDAERLTESAANTLLKFLEELPSQVSVIMTSSEPYQILATVRSRLTAVNFTLASMTELRASKHDRQSLQRSAGRPGWILPTDVATAERQSVVEHQLWPLPNAAVGGASARENIERRLAWEELVLRDRLLATVGSTDRLLWPAETQPVEEALQPKILELLNRYLDRHQLSASIQSRLVYDNLHLV
jgi:DNA polymerase-3 subunit gamma/tau